MDPRERKHDSPSEQELDQDLERLRRNFPDPDAAEPPELVDQAVMNMARRELAARRERKPLRWLGAFATAAVVVLALTLVVRQDPRPPAPALQEQDGFRLDAPEKQELRREPLPSVDAESEAVPEARLEKKAQIGSDRAAGPTSSPAAVAADDAEAAVRRQAAVPPAALASKPETTEAQAPAASAVEFAAEPMAEVPEVTEGLSDTAKKIPEPAEWVERLLLLKQSRLYEQLEQELAAFRETYPDYPLPPELQD